MSNFWAGFTKRAAPKWLKVLKESPEVFKKHFDVAGSSGGGMGGQLATRGLHRMLSHPKREALEEALGLQRTIHPHIERPLSDSVRRSLYVKRGKDWLRQEPAVLSREREYEALLKAYPDLTNLPSKDKMLLDAIQQSKALIEGGSVEGHLPYRNISSKNMIDVAHTSMNPEKLLSSENLRTPSAVPARLPPQGVYAFPKGVPDIHAFSGASLPELRSAGGDVIHSKVPEKAVKYLPNISTRRLVDKPAPEIYVPQNVFKKGLTHE